MRSYKLFFVLFILPLFIQAQSSYPLWPRITAECRPGTRWWWLGSAVDSLNLAQNLDEYAKAGIATVEITPIYGVQGNEDKDIPFLSDQWMHQLRNVYDIAADHGILVDMNQGTGWPFGSPEVAIDDAACKIVFLIDTVPPGVIADESLKQLPDKERGVSKPIARNTRILEDGSMEVIRAFQSRTLQKVKRAAPGGEGLVLDHFDKGAVGRYLDKFDDAFNSTSTPYPHCFFNDSYEVYNANWTPSLPDEFKKRRGYDLMEHLAELIGTVDDGNIVLADYRHTLAELLLENFTEQWAERAHAAGTIVRNQAHGSPANLIDVYAAVDIPEIEGFGLSDFGIKGLRTDPGHTRPNYSDVSMLKYASSAAHITGKPLTSSETLTWLTEHFRTSLSQMKPDIDLMLTCGVNRIFFHGTAYSPADEPWPGWKFYASVDISPTNTIWRDLPAMTEYIARCQSMLQKGSPDNDFLVYLPIHDLWRQRRRAGEKGLLMTFAIENMREQAPEFIDAVMRIDSLGYDCDYISDHYLMGTHYCNGMLETAAGTRYKALIVPHQQTLLTEALRSHLDSLQHQGARIIYGIDADLLRSAAQSETMRTMHGLRSIRRSFKKGDIVSADGRGMVDGDGYFYFIANLTSHDVDDFVTLAVPFKNAIWLDPLSGDIYPAQKAAGRVKMDLRSGQSRILLVTDGELPSGLRETNHAGYVCQQPRCIDLTCGDWSVSVLPPSSNRRGVPPRKWYTDTVKPWTDLGIEGLDRYAGTMVYYTEFDMDADTAGLWTIDLGDVRESARVYLNDTLLGTAWAVPFVLDCRGALTPGINRLRIEVTNLPANRIAAMDRDSVQWRRFKEINFVDIDYRHTTYEGWEVMPAGLCGSVRLCRGKDCGIDSLNTWEHGYTRPIGRVLRDVERQFGVRINLEVDSMAMLPYADSRIRPYSIEETLDNLLKPLNFRWEPKGRGKYVVRLFDYPRRLFPEGKKMIDHLSSLYSNRQEWEARRDTLVPDARRRLGIDDMLVRRVEGARPEFSKERRHDGYTTRNFRIETLPGVHVCGTIYTPAAKGRHPLIICPNGHFAGGRYNEAQQQRLGTLARMGAICVDYDLVGWGESADELGEESHRTAMANTLQILNGITILDFMYSRSDVDTTRVGVNGGSGGGTQVITLALVDPRYTAACPVVSLAAHFDGGCPCESGRRITLAAGGSCHPEIAACFAPRPLGLVSDGGDWTAQVPEVEFPYLQRIYGFYGAQDAVSDVHLPDERHDFGPNKRRAVYDFFARVFGLDAGKIDESRVTIESEAELRSR